MRVVLTESADELAARAGDLLASRIEHNVLATVLGHARHDDWTRGGSLFAYVESDAGDVVAAALRVPRHHMLASAMDEDSADALIGAWLARDPELPGVGAPREVARSLARAWERRSGGHATLAMAEALHSLDRVRGPDRPASGRLRRARGRSPDRPRVHAARSQVARVRIECRRRREPCRSPRRGTPVHPVHRSRQPHVESDLCRARLSPRARMGGAQVQASTRRIADPANLTGHMAVRLRLTRVGGRKNPIWRVVVADQRSKRDGRVIETVGHYNAQTDPSTIVLDEERIRDWLARGAQPSQTVRKLLRTQGIS